MAFIDLCTPLDVPYHSYNPGGENKQLSVYFRSNRSNSCNIFRPRSCFVLGSEQEGWETTLLIGDGRLKWGASAPILMRSPRMKSLKQLPSFPFLDVCAMTANRGCHAF